MAGIVRSVDSRTGNIMTNDSNEEELPGLESRTSEERLKQNSGIKLSNKKSSLPDGLDLKQRFNDAVDDSVKESSEQIKQIIILGEKFKSILSEKRLPENMGPIQKSTEKEIVSEWRDFINTLNNDEDKPYGYGSLAAILLIFGSLIKFRDRANMVEYKNQMLEAELKEIKERLSKLETSRKQDPVSS